jgi:hypothetical protein
LDAKADNRVHTLILSGTPGEPVLLVDLGRTRASPPAFDIDASIWRNELPPVVCRLVWELYGLHVTTLTSLALVRSADGGTWESLIVLEDHTTERRSNGRPLALCTHPAQILFSHDEFRSAALDWWESLDRPHPLSTEWSQPGWFGEVSAWLTETLRTLNTRQVGPAEQVRTWSISCLLRVPATDSDYYFKAVPPLFAREPRLTRLLAERFPGRVPAVAALDEARRWMLLRAYQGREMAAVHDLETWKEALRGYARLQIESLAFIDDLHAAGCQLRGPMELAAGLDALLDDREALMLGQPRGLAEAEYNELRALAPAIKQACAEWEACGIPCTLEHGDFHGRNVAFTGDGFVYYDWTDGCIAHPFVCLTTALEEVEPTWHDAIEQAYVFEWSELSEQPRLQRALELSRVLGALHIAISYQEIRHATEPRLRGELGGALPFYVRQALQNKAVLEAGLPTR